MPEPSREEERVWDVVSEVFPAQVEVLGDDARDLVTLVYLGETPDYISPDDRGLTNDVLEAAKILFEAATFVKTTLEIYFMLREKLGRKPNKEELAEQTSSSSAAPPASVSSASADRIREMMLSVG